MPRAKQPFKLKRQAGAVVPVPLTIAVQSWLMLKGLHGGPLRQDSAISITYKTAAEAGQHEQQLSAQVMQQVMHILNF